MTPFPFLATLEKDCFSHRKEKVMDIQEAKRVLAAYYERELAREGISACQKYIYNQVKPFLWRSPFLGCIEL